MNITVNGAPIEVATGTTIHDLVESTHRIKRGVAVAVGGEVVPRSTWAAQRLEVGDHVEILTAVQGG